MTAFRLVLSILVVGVIIAGVAFAYVGYRSRAASVGGPPAPPTAEAAPHPEATAAEGVETEAAATVPERTPEARPFAPSLEGDRLVLPQKLWRTRLTKARDALGSALTAVLRSRKIDARSWDALEEALLGADVGVKMTMELVGRVERDVTRRKVSDPSELVGLVKEEILAVLEGKDRQLRRSETPPSVYLFAGVNGTGKTTTIAKLARRLIEDGESVVVAAADTYRAAATEQLSIWADRVGARLVKGPEGADPGAVVFDAIGFARARGAGYLLVDTAGRLHTNVNLMEELKKIARVASKAGAPPAETLLVIDATTGQNGLSQAARFKDAVQISGIVLTKLDGSARGGIVLAIEDELGVPVKLVGIGETAVDMVAFDPHEFADALFDAGIPRP